MFERSPRVQGTLRHRVDGNGKVVMDFADPDGRHLIIHRNMAHTIDAQGRRGPDFQLDWNDNRGLPEEGISREFKQALRDHALMQDAPPSFLAAVGAMARNVASTFTAVTVPMRQGDLANLAKAMEEEQARRDHSQAPAPAAAPEARAQEPGASVRQLADQFRQDAPPSVTQDRAEPHTPDAAPNHGLGATAVTRIGDAEIMRC